MVDIFALTEYGRHVATTAVELFSDKLQEAQARCSFIWTIVSWVRWLFGYAGSTAMLERAPGMVAT